MTRVPRRQTGARTGSSPISSITLPTRSQQRSAEKQAQWTALREFHDRFITSDIVTPMPIAVNDLVMEHRRYPALVECNVESPCVAISQLARALQHADKHFELAQAQHAPNFLN
eukprot:2035685-Pleurochrysis_carterae.AAC.4